jgi:hypothetical protein
MLLGHIRIYDGRNIAEEKKKVPQNSLILPPLPLLPKLLQVPGSG